jgi:putative acetyltransferase
MIDLHIRAAAATDREAIRRVHLHAFADSENQRVVQLALDLWDSQNQTGAHAWVAEAHGQVIGHLALSPVTAPSLGPAHILAPLGVLPEHHGQGVGMALVRHGLNVVEGALVLVYGDPAYYSRFGFRAEDAVCCVPPYGLEHPRGWQARWPIGLAQPAEPVIIRCVPALNDSVLW